MAYDPACERLALEFLPLGASPRLIEELAQALQDAAERYLRAQHSEIAGFRQPRSNS
jgi:hypothetical protein